MGCGRSSDLHEAGYRDERDARIVVICDVKRTRVRAEALCSSSAAPRAVAPPPLMMFRDGKTATIEVERFEWHDSFLGCTRHLIAALRVSVRPVFDSPAGPLSMATCAPALRGRGLRTPLAMGCPGAVSTPLPHRLTTHCGLPPTVELHASTGVDLRWRDCDYPSPRGL